MPAVNAPLYSFNRGLVSRFALARTDLKRMALSAQLMTNWIPRTLGSMMLRPGNKYITTVTAGGQPKHIPFIFSVNDTAILQFGADISVPTGAMWVLVNEARIVRPAVTSTITNGAFLIDLTGWTSIDQVGGLSQQAVVNGFSCMSLTGSGANYAGRYQQVTVAGGNIGTEHAIRIAIYRGPVRVRVGSSLGAQDYVPEAVLGSGEYSLAFTPSGNFFLQFTNETVGASLVATTYNTNGAVFIEAAGVMLLPTPFGSADLPLLRSDQSADVVYIAANSQTTIGYQQQKIIRFGTRSWGVANFEPRDGPFGLENFTQVTLTPSALSGDTTLTASQKMFASTDIGRLVRINSQGQLVSNLLAGAAQSGDPIEVTGIGAGRTILIAISGVFVGTITLQYSVGAPGAWIDTATTFTAPTAGTTFADGFDNQIIFYRLTMTSYTSGAATAAIFFPVGTITGVCKITSFSSETVVGVRTLTNFGNLFASTDWFLGLWSNTTNWPTACRLAQGRLWFVGRDHIIGSVSGAFESFDDTITGDSGPIIEQIGSGPVDNINWIQATQRIVFGAESREIVARSSAINEPLTPTDFNLVTTSTMGSAPVDAAQVDTNIFFVQGARQHVIKMLYQPSYFGLDYSSSRETEIDPDLGLTGGGFNLLCVQRKPDTRLHGILDDGTVAILTYDEAEQVECWALFEFSGGAKVVDAFVLPGGDDDIEDKVYYIVLVNEGLYTSAYWLVRWARQDQCTGAALNLQGDAYTVYSGAPATVITGLTYADGFTVVAWADGKSVDNPDGTVKTFVVSGGQITLAVAASNVMVGLQATAQFQSTKLAYAAREGTALIQPKRITALGVIGADIHPRGLTWGRDFSHLDYMPLVYKGATLDPTVTNQAWDDIAVNFPGTWDTDSRLCLEAQFPRPVTLLAAVMELETSEKT